MAKKWKTGVNYQISDKEGLQMASQMNRKFIDFVGNNEFSVTKLEDTSFSKIICDRVKMNFPFFITGEERKYFKRVK